MMERAVETDKAMSHRIETCKCVSMIVRLDLNGSILRRDDTSVDVTLHQRNTFLAGFQNVLAFRAFFSIRRKMKSTRNISNKVLLVESALSMSWSR